jgi:hypothetical protein
MFHRSKPHPHPWSKSESSEQSRYVLLVESPELRPFSCISYFAGFLLNLLFILKKEVVCSFETSKTSIVLNGVTSQKLLPLQIKLSVCLFLSKYIGLGIGCLLSVKNAEFAINWYSLTNVLLRGPQQWFLRNRRCPQWWRHCWLSLAFCWRHMHRQHMQNLAREIKDLRTVSENNYLDVWNHI